jgi:hypothetical protein
MSCTRPNIESECDMRVSVRGESCRVDAMHRTHTHTSERIELFEANTDIYTQPPFHCDQREQCVRASLARKK